MKSIKFCIVATTALFLLFASPVRAFDPINKTIDIIVPFPPGGNNDRWARIISDIFRDHGWKSAVINKPGGASVIAATAVAEARADGHTLLVTGNSVFDNLVFAETDRKLPYNENSFAPVISLGTISFVLAASSKFPADSYEEFKAFIRANPNKFNVGVWNPNVGRLVMSWAKKERLPQPNLIIYKGSGQMQVDLLGNNVPLVFDAANNVGQYYQNNQVKILAALDTHGDSSVKKFRHDARVPIIATKFPELDVPVWIGLFAPAGTDQSIIEQINRVLNRGFADTKYADTISGLYMINHGGTPEYLRDLQIRILRLTKNIAKE